MQPLNGTTDRDIALEDKLVIGRQMVTDTHYAKTGKNFALEIFQPMTLAVGRNSVRPTAIHKTMSQAGFDSFAGGLNAVKMSCRTTANNTTAMVTPEPFHW